jgi:hypothetical protein
MSHSEDQNVLGRCLQCLRVGPRGGLTGCNKHGVASSLGHAPAHLGRRAGSVIPLTCDSLAGAGSWSRRTFASVLPRQLAQVSMFQVT